jgi:hypothetical protein
MFLIYIYEQDLFAQLKCFDGLVRIKMYQVVEQDVDQRIHLTIIDVSQIDSDVKHLMDENLVPICEGTTDSDISLIKADLIQLFERKDSNWMMGAIAEFFMHLYIRTLNYKQEFLYRNLEEDSIKKGFDGLFSKANDFWLMESKSGSIDTKGISHASKIKEANEDLRKKVAGVGQSNNPWRNAYNHACNINVDASDSLRNDLKKLKEDFIKGNFRDINEFNTIPCGTIFLNGSWQSSNIQQITQNINDMKDRLHGKNVLVVCMTQNTIDMFLDYIHS